LNGVYKERVVSVFLVSRFTWPTRLAFWACYFILYYYIQYFFFVL